MKNYKQLNILNFKIIENLIKGYILIYGHIKTIIYLLVAYLISYRNNYKHKQNECWLIGENYGVCLDDNAYKFFKYCILKHTEIDVYFVTKKISFKYYPELINDKNILVYGSSRHIRKLILSNAIIFSHTKRDIIYKYICPLIDKNKVKVFLQHGVTAFKKFNKEYLNNVNYIDIIIATSDREKNILSECIGINTKNIKTTGFPRFDYLSKNKIVKRQILYIPTWRDWINKEFNKTDFYKKIQSLLSNSYLSNQLRKNNIIIKFYLHKNMANKLQFFYNTNPDVIKFVKLGEESVQKLINQSCLMITDYSSVAWDFLYLKKPVIMYQYDLNDYQKYRGSYIDFNTFEFGDIIYYEVDLIAKIIQYINDDFIFSKAKSNLHKKYFEFYDKNNSQRVFTEIQEILISRNK